MRIHSQAFVLYIQKQVKKFYEYFLRGVQIHFRVENIYGRDFLFFTRFMPTNGFAQPFVGIISFWLHLYGGSGWIRTTEAEATDLQSAPFDRSGTLPFNFKVGAGGRTRTPDLLITNQLLYQLSYTSICSCHFQRLINYSTRVEICQVPF